MIVCLWRRCVIFCCHVPFGDVLWACFLWCYWLRRIVSLCICIFFHPFRQQSLSSHELPGRVTLPFLKHIVCQPLKGLNDIRPLAALQCLCPQYLLVWQWPQCFDVRGQVLGKPDDGVRGREKQVMGDPLLVPHDDTMTPIQTLSHHTDRDQELPKTIRNFREKTFWYFNNQ